MSRYWRPEGRILDQNVRSARPRADRDERITLILLGIGALALAVRVLYVLVQTRAQLFDAPFVAADSVLYLELGANIGAGEGMRTDEGPTAFVGPVYPLLIAVLLRAGLDPLGIGLFQALIGAAAAVLVALVARELAIAAGYDTRAQPVVMWVAGIGTALYPHMVLWTGYVLTETLFLCLAAGCVYATLQAARKASLPAAVAAGALGSFASLTRSAFLACAILILGWLIWSASGRRYALAVLFFVALAFPMALWAARNAADLGRPIFTATQGGASLYQGNARGGTGGSRGYSDSLDAPPLELPPGLNEVERDDFYMRHAIDDIRADPAGTIARWPSKLWNMWRPAYEGASLRNGVVTLATYAPLVAFGGAGMVLLAMRSRGASLPAILVIAWAATHMVIVGLIRYRVPGELFLLMAFPFGVEAAWRSASSVLVLRRTARARR